MGAGSGARHVPITGHIRDHTWRVNVWRNISHVLETMAAYAPVSSKPGSACFCQKGSNPVGVLFRTTHALKPHRYHPGPDLKLRLLSIQLYNGTIVQLYNE
jgi:hypothetical protein